MTKSTNQLKFSTAVFVALFSGMGTLIMAQLEFPQYLFPEFSKTMVLMKNGKSQSILMNYNMVTERMVYNKDGVFFDMVNPETIDTVFILDRKFIPIGKIYYELMLQNTPLTLLIQHKGELESAGTPAAYGGTSQVAATTSLSSIELSGGRYNLSLPPQYVVKTSTVYWIRKQNEMFSFINEKQFLKIFPDKESELKKFIKDNRIKIDKPDQLKKLVSYCNGLMR
jgi:hypothetical protein